MCGRHDPDFVFTCFFSTLYSVTILDKRKVVYKLKEKPVFSRRRGDETYLRSLRDSQIII